MSSLPAIEVRNLGKRYRLGSAVTKAEGPWQGVKKALSVPFRYLLRATTKAKEEDILWAIKGVSFELQPGEVVGMIGRNGAGKTTTLKILSRITDPTEGSALIRGRVASLLQVGTGFHPELTGRENTFLNGAIMGMKRLEIVSKFEEIVEFAEVAKFIDTPVKYYSSGMYVRLAFAVAAHLEPEILLVDEVLAVGDLGFQRRCLGKMGEVSGQGRTVVLVSHNMESILGLCPRTIWIDGGRVRADGPSREVVGSYTAASLKMAANTELRDRDQGGDGLITFTKVSLRNGQGELVGFATCGEPLQVVIDYQTHGEMIKNASVWFWVLDTMGRGIHCLWSRLTGDEFSNISPRGSFVCSIPRLRLAPGVYSLSLAVLVAGSRTHKVPHAARLEVAPGDFYGAGRKTTEVGIALCEHSWSLVEAEADKAGHAGEK